MWSNRAYLLVEQATQGALPSHLIFLFLQKSHAAVWCFLCFNTTRTLSMPFRGCRAACDCIWLRACNALICTVSCSCGLTRAISVWKKNAWGASRKSRRILGSCAEPKKALFPVWYSLRYYWSILSSQACKGGCAIIHDNIHEHHTYIHCGVQMIYDQKWDK